MNKKTMLIGLGVLAVAGIGYYMWKKKNETTSSAEGEEYSCAVRCGNGCWYASSCGLGHGKSLGCGKTNPSA
jgi:hypothetical protein